jgi:hypothetical protein
VAYTWLTQDLREPDFARGETCWGEVRDWEEKERFYYGNLDFSD